MGDFDLISRESMLRPHEMRRGGSVMPFVQMFYGQPGTLWQDDLGEAHTIHQGEEGEQGDPLMPLLFSLGQHSPLEAVNSRLQEDDRLMALLDDLYLVNPRPDSVLHSYTGSHVPTMRHQDSWETSWAPRLRAEPSGKGCR